MALADLAFRVNPDEPAALGDILSSMNGLPDALAVLSAMITPAVLISVAGLHHGDVGTAEPGRGPDARDLPAVRGAAQTAAAEKAIEPERRMLFSQLHFSTNRSRMLQRALSRLYWALGLFVGTSVAIGVVAVSSRQYAWIPLVLGLAGAGLLLYASMLLVRESRVALEALDAEMDFVWQLGTSHATRSCWSCIAVADKGERMDKVNLEAKLSMFSEHWQPRTVGQFNGHDLMVVKVQGEFVWHQHDDTDDLFWSSGAISPSRCGTAVSRWGPASCSWCPKGSSTPGGPRGGSSPAHRADRHAEHGRPRHRRAAPGSLDPGGPGADSAVELKAGSIQHSTGNGWRHSASSAWFLCTPFAFVGISMLQRRFLVLFALAVSLCAPAFPADGPFRDLSRQSLPARGGAWEIPLPRHFRALEVDVSALESLLARAPAERSAAAATAPLLLALPYPDGTDRLFRVEESPILEPELAARFPEIRTFVAQGIDDPTATARLSLTSLGFHAMVLSAAGTVFVDPYRRWDARYVLSYFKAEARKPAGADFHCDVKEEGQKEEEDFTREVPPIPLAVSSGTQLRTYRLALAATGEYSAAVCAPNPAAVACALNAMVVTMNRVDGVYEREVAIRMVLIANDNLIVYTNGATDPYSNGDGPTMLGQNQSNLDSVIGSANYDIGHVVSTGGGGIAQLNVPCTSSKASGVTGQPNPVGDSFDIDYVAHEMGHQFGGSHTFNGTTLKCSGNRSASFAYEPGSGTTIMAYAGICGAEDLQPHSDDTFHTRSFDQIVAFSTGTTGAPARRSPPPATARPASTPAGPSPSRSRRRSPSPARAPIRTATL